MSAPQQAVPRSPRSGLIMGLVITCAVLLVTTIGLGAAATWLWLDRSGSAASAPTATPAPEESPQIVRGMEISSSSDYSFGPFAMTSIVDGRYTVLYATIENDDPDQGVAVFFDATAYAEDGRIIDRTPASQYLLPGQISLFRGVFSEDLSDAVSIKVEQTMSDVEAPIMTGAVTMDSVSGGDDGYVEGTLTSTLSQVPEYPELFIVAFVDGEIYAVCDDLPDIPANGSFTAHCFLELTSKVAPSKSEGESEFGEFPEDAVFDAFLSLSIPF